MIKIATAFVVGLLVAWGIGVSQSHSLEFTSELQQSVRADVPPNTKTVTPPKSDRYIVKDDPGGNVLDFEKAIKYFSDNHMKIKVDGMCASACTLLLQKDKSVDVCVTKNAVFMIHHPYVSNLFGINFTVPAVAMADQFWKEHFVAVYPDWVNTYIDAHGGAPNVYKGDKQSDTLDIHFETLAKFMTVCDGQ